MSMHRTAAELEAQRIALWQEALIGTLGSDLKRCIEYLDDADGLECLLGVARRFGATPTLLHAIRLYHAQVLRRP